LAILLDEINPSSLGEGQVRRKACNPLLIS